MSILRSRKRRITDEIPTSAMADIAFLLLIFFLMATAFPRDQGLRVVLPEESGVVEVGQSDVFQIIILPDGTIRVREGDAAERSVLPRELEAIWQEQAAVNSEMVAAVQTHPAAEHRHMISVLDALQLAGAGRISLQMLEIEP